MMIELGSVSRRARAYATGILLLTGAGGLGGQALGDALDDTDNAIWSLDNTALANAQLASDEVPPAADAQIAIDEQRIRDGEARRIALQSDLGGSCIQLIMPYIEGTLASTAEDSAITDILDAGEACGTTRTQVREGFVPFRDSIRDITAAKEEAVALTAFKKEVANYDNAHADEITSSELYMASVFGFVGAMVGWAGVYLSYDDVSKKLAKRKARRKKKIVQYNSIEQKDN